MSELKIYKHKQPFKLESGEELAALQVGYHTWGKLNAEKSNVVWVFHALTASSNVEDWWPGVAGKQGYFNPEEHFIICVNILGSVYGSSNPSDIDPATGEIYGLDFPFYTIRDIVGAQLLVKEHLGIDKIWFALGGSCGGQQLMEFAYLTQSVEHMMIIAASPKESAWSIAIHTAQRLSLEADGTWGEKNLEAGKKGLAAARGIGLLGYRTYQAYIDTQSDYDNEKLDDFKADSYIRYQGKKLVNRFNAYAYYHLTKAMDSHNLGRGRGSIQNAFSEIDTRSLILAIDTDSLITPEDQKKVADLLPNSVFKMIPSPFGHDGFLVEQDLIVNEIDNFLNSQHGFQS